MMEEKILQYERIKASLLRHRGNVDLVQTDTKYPMKIILEARSKMPKELRMLPEKAKVYIAENTFWMIYDGVQERKQNLRDMLEALHKREQIIVCIQCRTEIVGEPGKLLELGMCPKCDKMVYRTKQDRLDIIDSKRAILKQEADEDRMAADYASRLFAIKSLPSRLMTQHSESQDTPVDSLPINPLAIEFTGSDKEIAAATKNMKPGDRQMFAQRLLERMNVLDAEITREENTDGTKS